jgi:serine phosphatase RsbU (regulator of sigma subunit)
MARKPDLNDLSQRLADLGARLDAKLGSPEAHRVRKEGLRIVETVLSNLHDLFTRGVTHEGMRDMVRREVRDSARFYTSQIDFDALRELPWFKRYPFCAWKIFTATAFRLSPPRRLAFAVASLAFLVGCIEFITSFSQPRAQGGGIFYWSVAIAIYLLLLLMELRDKLDLKGDLEIAREIQIGLVPSLPFQKGAIDIRSRMRPANTVGGDYHDIIDLGENLIGIVIGDVAGKGIPAALLMALLQGSLRTLLTAGLRGPELIAKLNKYLYDNIPSNRLVTLFYGELRTDTGEFLYVNAGHNAPYLLRPGRPADRLDATSLVLGVLRDAPFEARSARLEPGERLLLFTDGVSEAFNDKDEEYGEDRLTDFLQRHPGEDQDKLIADIIRDVLEFCDSKGPGDDMTMMVVKHI